MKNILVYIDGTNLYKGIESLNREINYTRFKKWLTDKYDSSDAYIFMGYIHKHEKLYLNLQESGFNLIFKESFTQKGIVKGNADAEMLLKSVRDYFEKIPSEVILITGDGDFSCLIDFLIEKKVFKAILVPSIKYCSYLIRKKNIKLTRLDHPRLINKFTTEKRTLARDLPL